MSSYLQTEDFRNIEIKAMWPDSMTYCHLGQLVNHYLLTTSKCRLVCDSDFCLGGFNFWVKFRTTFFPTMLDLNKNKKAAEVKSPQTEVNCHHNADVTLH